jgi:hypothetical protein
MEKQIVGQPTEWRQASWQALAMSDQRPEEARRPLARLARAFLDFADQECGREPVYDTLCRAAAHDPDTLRLLWHAPAIQQRPNLLLAAVHDLVLRGLHHPLCDYFPSAGGTRRVDRELVGCFAAFRDAHAPELIARIARRTTQTNEIGRCAILWPCLQYIARREGRHALALLDFGCSAGLNLSVDAYRYEHGAQACGAPASPETPVIACRRVGDGALPRDASPRLRIAARVGVDINPVDLDDEEAVRWLRACLWPHDVERARRFDLALAIARDRTWPVLREADCIDALERWLDCVPADVLPVVWNSWVLAYLEPSERSRFVSTVETLIRERSLVWLSAESPSLGHYPCDAPAPALPEAEYVAGTLWTMCSRKAGAAHYHTLARAHPHGRWIEWLARR